MKEFISPKTFKLKTIVDKRINLPQNIIAIGKGETEVSGEYNDSWTWYYDKDGIHYPTILVDNLYTETKD